MSKRYNVEIFEYATGKTYSVIGKNLRENKVEAMEMLGLSKCNERYGTRAVEV